VKTLARRGIALDVPVASLEEATAMTQEMCSKYAR
jgi:hypothetical protein